MRKEKLFVLLFTLLIFCSCGKRTVKPDQPEPPAPEPPAPTETTKAILLSPTKDALCYSEASNLDDYSSVTFRWQASAFAEFYTLVIKNLQTSESTRMMAHQHTSVSVTLKRSTPFSWYIETKSSLNTKVLESEVWRFYNAGLSTSSYAPYPATLSFPALDAQLTIGTREVKLAWIGADVEYDIRDYDVYFGTTTNPPLLKAANVDQTFVVSVNAGERYYWKIVSRDAAGHTSQSAIYHFRVL